MDGGLDGGVARRIVAAIKERIHSGLHPPGSRLPATRVLAAEWGVSRTTVTAAYGQLIAEGYLHSRPGARAVVAPGVGAAVAPADPPAQGARRVSAFAERLLARPQAAPPTRSVRVADFRYGDLSGADFPVLAWRRAVNRACLRRPARLRYDDPRGSAALREALHGYLWRARGIQCTPERIIVVNGSQQGLDLCARLFLDPGDRFLFENPGYALARHAFAAVGGVEIPVAVDAEGLRTDALHTEALAGAALAYVTPSHQFPLGGVLSAARRRALLDWAARGGGVVIEDDYDGEYRHGIAPIPPLQTLAPESVVYVGTLSKTLSPTLRVGYLVVPTGLERAFAEAKRLTDRHAPLLEQEAVADLLASGAYERHVRSVRRKNADRRAVLLAALAAELGDRAVVAGTDAGLHMVLWLPGIPTDQESALVADGLAAGIGLYPVSPLYAPNGGLGGRLGGERPACAGLVLGYAALTEEALCRGVAVLAGVVRGLR